MRRRGIAGAVVLALVVVAGCGGGSDTAAIPDLAVRSLADGEAATLADYEGTPMVLNLWAPWCAPCKQEMPAFDQVAGEQGDAVRIVGLATGTEEAAAIKYATEIAVSYELIYDVDDEALGELGVTALPATLFVDADGTILDTHSGVLTADELTGKINTLLLG